MSEQTFSGFPQEGLQFLADLKDNNNREWFTANKQVYQNMLIAPAQAFIVTLGKQLQTISKNVQYDTRMNGSGSMMRIYRDIRFSKDKTPYKTSLGIIFWEGAGKKNDLPAFYFGFDGSGGGVHAGMYHFPKPFLNSYREAILDDEKGTEFTTILADFAADDDFNISEPHYKRVPRGYDKEHPRADYLRYNGIILSTPRLTAAQLSSPELVDVCVQRCRQMAPLQQWLVNI